MRTPESFTEHLTVEPRQDCWWVVDGRNVVVAGPFASDAEARAWIAGYGHGASDHF